MIDETTYMDNFDDLINKKYMYYPYRDKIKVIDFFVNGVFHKIYWLKEDLDKTEKFVWKYRKGVSMQMNRAVFVNNLYASNTLIRDRRYIITEDDSQFYKWGINNQSENDFYLHRQGIEIQISNNLLFEGKSDGIESIIRDNEIRWLQIPEAIYSLFRKRMDDAKLKELGVIYIEILTTDFWLNKGEQSQDEQSLSSVSDDYESVRVNTVGFSPLVGYFMCNGNLFGEVAKLKYEGDDLIITSTCNRIVPIKNYKMQRDAIVNNKTEIHDMLSVINNRAQKVAEFINETMGKIVIKESVEYDVDKNMYEIELYIRESYKGWEKTIKDQIENELRENNECFYKEIQNTKGLLYIRCHL